MKKLLRVIFSRMMLVGLLFAIQLGIIIFAIWRLSKFFVYFYLFGNVISILVVIYLLNKEENPSYKLAWTIPIMIFPWFGGLLYIILGANRIDMKFIGRLKKVCMTSRLYTHQNQEIVKEIEAEDHATAGQVRYINKYAHYPIYKGTQTQYFSPGEAFYESLVEALENAKHSIFMEYFIIEDGKMWNSIVEILKRKATEGLDVRVMYDDVGCLTTLPFKYEKILQESGIKCAVFNPVSPIFRLVYNNRDHRKITVVDGYIGFMGGINLADEYINVVTRFGHWKDAAIMLKGEAVWNLTVMFLENWMLLTGADEDCNKFNPHIIHTDEFITDGYVQPYGDSPLDRETTGENVYLNLIHKAKKYVYICTPYLVIDNEMLTALTLAAKSGIDVRILTPHIEDKWYVHILTKSFYETLIKSGVKIYEYTPGFIHSKTVVCDDEIGIVGSINFDYRSLYLHFECATFLYKTKTVDDIKTDFLKTQEISIQVTEEDCKKVKIIERVLRIILRLIAPLM